VAENDITITVDADNRTTAAFGAAARGARTVGEATQNANRALREADNRFQAAAARAQLLANRQREAAERAQRLVHEALQLRGAIAQAGSATAEQAQRLQHLTRQQDRAAASARLLASQHRSTTEQVNDLARAYTRAERNAQEALRASLMFGAGARLGPGGEVSSGGRRDDGGPGVFARMLSSLPGFGGLAVSGAGAAGGATSNPLVGTSILAVAAGAAAVLAPLLGGAVGGLVTGAGAFGGVGLGVAGAIANDPEQFKAIWGEVTEDVSSRWRKASASWMEPVKGSIAEVDQMLRRLPIESILSSSAAYLEPLTKGLTGFGTNLADGFARMIADAGPVVEMLGTRLPKLGADLGMFFAALGRGSEGGAVALDDLLYALGRLTKGLGVTLAALGEMYKGIHDFTAGVTDAAGASADWVASLLDGVPVLDSIAEKIKKFRSGQGDIEQGTIRFRGAGEASDDFKRVQQSAADAAKAVQDYVDATQKMLDLAMGNKSASLALAEGWLKLNEELRNGKRVLGDNTQAGIDNQQALLNQVAAAERARQSQIALTGDVNAANVAFDVAIERIRKMAYDLGFNKQQVDALIASLGVLNVTKAAPKVELTGAELAMEQGIALGALLNRISHTYTAKVQVVTGPGISLGNALHHAIGGPTSPGPSVINEWGGQGGVGGGEVVSLPTGSMVYGGAAARGGDAAATGGAGGGVQVVQLQISGDGSAAADYALDVLAKATRLRGNGSVQIAVMGRAAPGGR
jgi:hypothetical protein